MQSKSSDLLTNQVVPGRNLQCVYIASLPELQTAFHQHKLSEQLFMKNNIAQGYFIDSEVYDNKFYLCLLMKNLLPQVIGSFFRFAFFKNRTKF